MANSPTIVAASLDGKALEESINKLVQTIDAKTTEMAKSFTDKVGQMEQAVKNLGNIKFDANASSGGGAKKISEGQKELETQTKRTTQAAKEQQMTFDQLVQGLKQAMGVVSNFNTLRQHIDPSKQDYAEYERALARIVEYNERLKISALEVATANEKAFAYNAKNDVKNLFATDERLKQLGQYYAEEEKLAKRASEKRVAAQEKETAAQKKLIDEQYKLAYSRANKIPTDQYDLVQAKLERLQALLRDMRERGLLNPSQIASTEAEIRRLEQILANSTQYQQQITQSSRVYTEEIRKQAQAIRESQQWKEKGRAIVGERVYYDPERSTLPAKDRLSLEEQILNTQKEEEVAAIRAANAQRQEAAEKAATEQEARKVLATEQQITAEQQKRSQPKTFASYDSLRESIAHVLGMQQSQIKLADTETASYNNLSTTLKQLKQAYDRLSSSERNSDQGKALVASIHEVERAMQKIRSQASRPISLESIIGINGKGGLSEKTLDDIAYKMQRLASYRSGLNVEAQQTEIRTVNAEYDRLKKKMDEVMQKNQQLVGSNNALGRSWNYMKNRLAFYFTVGASTQFVKNLIEVRSQYEMNERALGILINSAERGTQIFNELSQMALVSPYTLIELSAAAKQLTAYDIAARDVVDTTRRLADMASAVGVPIERLTYALGQIKAYGYLNSRDARMFANAGIPLVKQLSDYYTELEGKMVSTADVYDRMKKKAIDYNSVMSVINKMTDEGGKFFDFQAKMANTLKVRLANLTLAWNNMLNDMGKETQGVLTFGIGALRDLFLHWKQLDVLIKDTAWILGIRTGFMLIAYAALKAGGALGITTRQMALSSVVGTKLAGVLGTLGRSIATIVKSPLTWWSLLALAAWDIFDAFTNADKATIEFNKSLRDSAKTTYEDLKKFAEQYKDVRDSLYTTQKTAIGNIYDPSTGKAAATAYANQTVGQDISASEAKKVWEAMREQIELSSHASDEYISKLLSIENVSERLRQGFQIIDNIQAVSAALKEVGDDGIKVVQGWSAWWNAYQLPDGLIGNIKEVANAEKELIENFGSIEAAKQRGGRLYTDYEKRELENFRKDLKVTTDSVIDFINLNGWSGDTGKIDEVFKQVTDRLVTQGNLDPQTAFTLQREVEVARAKAAKEALEIRIADEKKALATASDEISKQQIQKNLETLEQQKRDFDKFNGENRAYWNDFTKYIKERHISELTAAYNSMTDHGKKAMDFQSEEWQKRVHDWANRYEKSHNLATDSVFNRLKNWINDANTWSVFIKMTISTEDGKSIYKQLEEYDKAADDAWKTMQRLDKRISQLRKKGAKEVVGAETSAVDLSRVSQDDRELTEALKERTQAQKDYNDAVKKGGESKKENAAASKAQKQAESELQKALKDEIQLIEQVRSQYKKLTDAGVKHGTALTMVTTQFRASIEHINNVLQKNGMPKFDVKAFAGTDDPHAILAMLRAQIDRAKTSSSIKPEEIKALEVEYGKVVVDAQVYDTTKITKGLNNELDKLKEEYELAVELDANPELGGMFAEMFDIDLETLPKTAEEYADQYTKFLNKYLEEKGSDLSLPNLLNLTSWDMNAFREQMEKGDMNKEWYDVILKGYLATREARKKETSETIKDYEKLLEKYAEYETKVNKIQNDAVKERVTFAQQFGSEGDKNMALNLQTQILAATDPQEKQKLIQQLQELVKSIAGDDKAKLNIVTSIDNGETKGLAKASFEEFQKSPEWITATGELSGMTNKAINGLIASLEKYKKSAKNLDPKQIKNINNALKNLYKEQRKNNPFGAIANMIDKAKERMADVEPEMESIMSDIIALEKEIGDGEATEGQIKTLEELKERWQTLSEIGEITAGEWVDSLMSVYGAIKGAIGLFDDLAKAIGGTDTSDIEKIFGVLDKAGQGAQIGAAFGGYGAIIGAVVGAATGIIETFADQWSGNAAITEEVEESVKAVKHLELAYVDLQQAVDKAYGTAVIGAKQATLANKELQLAELQRQIQLEKSRKSKNRDEDKILELQKQYKELFYEIQNGYRELVDDLMGTDVASFAENLVSSMIDAFKQGEDYMDVFNKKFDEMIDNMIMKSIVSRVVSQYLNQIWDSIDQRINDRSQEERDEYAKAQSNAEKVREMSDAELVMEIAKQRLNDGVDMLQTLTTLTDKDIEEYRKAVAAEEIAAKKRLDAASEFTGSDVDYIMGQITEVMPELGQKLKEILGEYYKFGESSETQLSGLQQGLQSMSESTANALEAYANSISQQAYLRNDLLVQIRDTIMSFDMDVQLGVFSQMLLQLQNNYIIMQSMQSMMEGWTTPSGQGIRVELIS